MISWVNALKAPLEVIIIYISATSNINAHTQLLRKEIKLQNLHSLEEFLVLPFWYRNMPLMETFFKV